MYELYPYFTNDGSVGLFSPDADDIYHSTYGALTEAYEKFILPSNLEKYFSCHNEIKILDICFGIGYNTKSFLNYFFEKIFRGKNISKNQNNASIDTNNINYNDTIYTDNQNVQDFSHEAHVNHGKTKIFITALDTDKNLAFLSPFFINGKNNIKNNHIDFEQEKISRMLSKTCQSKFHLKNEINIILLLKIIENHPEILEDTEFLEILNNRKYRRFFDRNTRGIFEFYKSREGKYTPYTLSRAFLHNIYYKYISVRHKKAFNALKTVDFDFDLKIGDARQSLLSDKTIYNFVFLDAFTPVKCPCLWTVNFFRLLYEHLESDGMILTYSSSANIRNAFLSAGFYIGKVYNQTSKKFMGTVAVKNKTLIEHELSEFDLGLLKTKAGIFYRDENLSLENEAIIAAHKTEVEKSTLISSTQYLKNNARQKV